MNATNKRKGDVTASASHAEGEADSLLHGLRRRSPLGRTSSERLTGPVWKRFGDKSRSRRSTTHASLHRPDVERSTLRDRVRSRGLRKTSTPIVSGSRLQREAVHSGSMEEGKIVRRVSRCAGFLARGLATRAATGTKEGPVSIPEAGRCVEPSDQGAASRETGAPPQSNGDP